jgi:hypothetical protein
MNDIDYELFKGKTFGSLCKDIVKNAEEKKTQLDIVITDLREMIKTLNDAVTVLPMMEAYFEVGVRNDEQLIKLAAIIQRLIVGKVGADGENGMLVITDEEKKQLMTVVEELAKPVKAPDLLKEPIEVK